MNDASGSGSAEPGPTPPPHPGSATPYPTSATPYPTSATPYPTSVAPYSGYVLTPPATPRLSAWVWVLAGVCVLLLAVAGGLGLHYQGVRAANERQAADRSAHIEELKTDLRRLDSERDGVEEERDLSQAALEGTRDQIQEHRACPDSVVAFGEAVAGGTEAEQDAAFEAMVAACNVTL